MLGEPKIYPPDGFPISRLALSGWCDFALFVYKTKTPRRSPSLAHRACGVRTSQGFSLPDVHVTVCTVHRSAALVSLHQFTVMLRL